MGATPGPPTLKSSKQIFSIYPSLEMFKKPEDKDHNDKCDLKLPGGGNLKINEVEDR